MYCGQRWFVWRLRTTTLCHGFFMLEKCEQYKVQLHKAINEQMTKWLLPPMFIYMYI